MNTKTYLRRAAKYLVYIIIFMALGFGVWSLVSSEPFLNFESLNSSRGLMLGLMLVCFSLLQPLWAYGRLTLNFDATKVGDKTTEILELSGYELTHQSLGEEGNGLLVYRYKSSARRILGGYTTDGIRITTVGGVSVISGARRDIIPVHNRLTNLIK